MIKVNEWNEHTKAQWNKQAINWDKRSINMWDNGSRKDIIPFFTKHHQANVSVIDIGCGSGYGSYKLLNSGYDVTGIDISEKMIELARKQLNDQVPLYVASVDDLPFADESFDASLLINVIEWTKNPLDALLEIKRILKPGGTICAGILGATAGPRANSYQRLYKEAVPMNTMMPWEFYQLAKENGFRLIEERVIYKKVIEQAVIDHLPDDLQQAISFMTLFMLKKESSHNE